MEALPRPEEIVERAREAGLRERAPLSGGTREALRRAVAELCADLTDDGPASPGSTAAREEAVALLPGAEQLLGRIYAAQGGTPEEEAWLAALAAAAEQLVAGAAAVARGSIDAAAMLDRARAAVVEATRTLPGWAVGHPDPSPVFDASTGSSRYDARVEDVASYRLTCPAPGCHRDHLYGWTPRHSTQRFTCAHCRKAFTAYLGEVRRLQVEASGVVAHYVLRCSDLDGTPRTFEFVDASGVSWSAAPGDHVVLIYGSDGALRAVHDLASGRHLWLTPRSACFVATAVYGPGAPELDVLRGFRDHVLASSAAGRAAVRAYYGISPRLANALAPHDRTRAALRPVLDAVVWCVRRLE